MDWPDTRNSKTSSKAVLRARLPALQGLPWGCKLGRRQMLKGEAVASVEVADEAREPLKVSDLSELENDDELHRKEAEDWINHKLESRLPRKISTTTDMQMIQL